jgi:hypothetical protein
MRPARLILYLLLGVVVLAVTAPAPAQSAELTFACYSPPQNPTPVPCHVWHTQPVRLAWSYDTTTAEAIDGDCTPQTIRADTAGTVVRCTIQDASDSSTTEKTATVKVDATAPTVTMVPARPPDHAGWWNQPVTVSFIGSDATSGIAACDSVPYAGPDSEAAQITGGCRDVAGNAAVQSFPLRYDASPPALTAVRSAPRDRGVTLSWRPSADSVRTEIVRSAGASRRSSTVVYSGTARSFTDRPLRNGVQYRYTITVYDQAGNTASSTRSATPFSLSPVKGARLSAPPLLRWHQVRRASYYNVQLFRGRRKILTTWPTATRLQLRREWTFNGRRLRLVPGRYRWYVWPGYGSRAAERYGRLIGHSTFSIVP